MLRSRSVLALLIVGVGALQAWDSHVLEAEPLVQTLVAVGILVPAVAVWLASRVQTRVAAVIVSAVLMVAARGLSSIRLPELTFATF
jgi:hypothetical protein